MGAVRVAFSFLTRLPVRADEVAPTELARALRFFPLVGAVLGALSWGSAWALSRVFPATLVGFAAVLIGALFTGGLHLDGVADLFDGLSGGRGDRERTLAIMRDSHIGAHGATALSLLLIGKVLASAALVERAELLPLAAAPICARFAAVLLTTRFPYARQEGLGRAMHEHARGSDLALASLLALGCVVPILALAPLQLTAALVLSLLCVLFAGAKLSRKLSGLTGDIYGAAIELCELCVLLLALAVTPRL